MSPSLYIALHHCRYTKVAAERITKTVLQTAISGGQGLMSSLHQSYSMSDLSLATEAAEERAVAPKRTMSMHRNRRERDQPHQTKRRGGAASTRGAVASTMSSTRGAMSSNSNMSSSRSVSSPRAAAGEAQAASKTCELYGTLPR